MTQSKFFKTLSIVMTTLACVIIMLHAIIPHHHHDCSDELGLVFETEVNCHCDETCNDCHHHTSHHPFDLCKLQELLSHLVLSNKEDEQLYQSIQQAHVIDLFVANPPTFDCLAQWMGLPSRVSDGKDSPIPLSPPLFPLSFRAPPIVA